MQITFYHVTKDTRLHFQSGPGFVLPQMGDTIEIAAQPPWPGGEQRTLIAIGINHLFNATTGEQTLSIEVDDAEGE